MKVTQLFALLGMASAECPNACSGHGTCGSKDSCACYQNYQGNDCSERTCYFGIAHVDTPKGDLNADGYVSGPLTTVITGSEVYPWGTTEQYPNADANEGHFYMECSNKGMCDRKTGTCDCFDGYEGTACVRASCPNDCSGHGTCESIKEIAEQKGFNTNAHDVPTTRMAGNAASTHHNFDLAIEESYAYDLWDQDKTLGCKCDPVYYGADCSLQQCTYGADPLFYDITGTPPTTVFVNGHGVYTPTATIDTGADADVTVDTTSGGAATLDFLSTDFGNAQTAMDLRAAAALPTAAAPTVPPTSPANAAPGASTAAATPATQAAPTTAVSTSAANTAAGDAATLSSEPATAMATVANTPTTTSTSSADAAPAAATVTGATASCSNRDMCGRTTGTYHCMPDGVTGQGADGVPDGVDQGAGDGVPDGVPDGFTSALYGKADGVLSDPVSDPAADYDTDYSCLLVSAASASATSLGGRSLTPPATALAEPVAPEPPPPAATAISEVPAHQPLGIAPAATATVQPLQQLTTSATAAACRCSATTTSRPKKLQFESLQSASAPASTAADRHRPRHRQRHRLPPSSLRIRARHRHLRRPPSRTDERHRPLHLRLHASTSRIKYESQAAIECASSSSTQRRRLPSASRIEFASALASSRTR